MRKESTTVQKCNSRLTALGLNSDACLLYTSSGVVFEPRFYEGLADMLKEDELPIFNWVWFGLYRSEGDLNGCLLYTSRCV